MANGISKNPLIDIGKVYLNQIAEGSLKSLEKASVLAMSDDPKDQDKAREIKTRFDYQSLMKQRKAKNCLLYTSPSPRDLSTSRMPSSA